MSDKTNHIGSEAEERRSIAPVTLNGKQQRAVEETEGAVKVVAGAGSGKTRVLAHRYAFLVNELGISPGNILCLTFTNKAAQEMKSRISRMVDRGSVNDFICTIHSFCVKFLRREIYRIGYPKSFLVMDEEDCKTLAKQAMQDFKIDRKKTTAERFLKQVAGVKGADPDAFIQRHILPASSPDCPDAVVRYIKLQLKQYALDFDDLLYFTIYILDHFEDARKYWTEKLNYIMIDEAQDCSSDDWKLINRLKKYHGNLFAVGDPDQAIYQWRGANPKMFIDMPARNKVILNENYRSTPDILQIANAIIVNNHTREPKDLYTKRLNQMRPVYHHCKSEKEEAEFIASTIRHYMTEGENAGSFAVLYRASYMSRLVEQALVKEQIPYTIWGGVRFFERKEVKDVLSYLRLIDSDNDDSAFRRIINLPSRKFGKASLEKLSAIAESAGLPLMTALRMNIDEAPFNRAPLHSFISLIDSLRQYASILSVSELTDRMLTESSLSNIYRLDEEESRLENISELINSMKEFETAQLYDGDMKLTRYLQEIALYTDMDCPERGKKVKLMTIHQSKGLEFPVVFIMGLTEGAFPSHRTIRERRKDGEEEERRLMYVAVTRACEMLYLTESEGYLNDTGAVKYPSRFITEIPDEMLTVEGKPDPVLFEGTRHLVDTINAETGEGDSAFEAGTVVEHRVFGRGIVQSYDHVSRSYKVQFNDKVRNLLERVIKKI